jgi:oligoendopeptidase F
VATTVNTADKEAERRYHNFLDNVYPHLEQADQRLKKKLLETGLIPDGFEIPLIKMRTEAEIFREANLPLLVQERKLANEYDKIIGRQTVEWEGKELTVAQLRPVYQSTDRALREEAWRLASRRQLEDRDAINNLWLEFLALREKLATNAGFSDYRSFRWKQLLRFDYTPEDCRGFHKAIEEAVVPAATRLCERRRRFLGVDSLRPWDLEVDPLGRGPLIPFQEIAQLQEKAAAIFHRVEPEFGSYFDTMVRDNLLDLENRKNKAPGGYCTEFSAKKLPFIFMNAVGIHDDVQTLLHEAGHSFHAFERSRLPYYQQRDVSLEFSEVASMAMELLASPYLKAEEGGFYTAPDAARARIEHLERCILFWPYMAVVDAFQHWVYENPEHAKIPSACDEAWRHVWDRFMPWIDWSGLEHELMTGWQRKLHIHTVPLYYVEYGLAQLGAVQVYGSSTVNRDEAVAAYRRALALGGTVSLPELYRAAGAKLAFDRHTLAAGVSFLEIAIADLRDD